MQNSIVAGNARRTLRVVAPRVHQIAKDQSLSRLRPSSLVLRTLSFVLLSTIHSSLISGRAPCFRPLPGPQNSGPFRAAPVGKPRHIASRRAEIGPKSGRFLMPKTPICRIWPQKYLPAAQSLAAQHVGGNVRGRRRTGFSSFHGSSAGTGLAGQCNRVFYCRIVSYIVNRSLRDMAVLPSYYSTCARNVAKLVGISRQTRPKKFRPGRLFSRWTLSIWDLAIYYRAIGAREIPNPDPCQLVWQVNEFRGYVDERSRC